ncbi:hypothetical protein DL765_010520 [Monosporascus sp. GIB2]|nr:hypothetical protein DL765_010520 [Monosporascus sp. GIB2]
MSAPSIPNILSTWGSRGGGRGGRRGRGGHPSSAFSRNHDAVIQGTDTDAAVSRMSAVELGYLEDPFAQFFVQRPVVAAAGGGPTRRLPIINRGTYVRTVALDRLISSFLSRVGQDEGQERQIVSLGAGTDTRCFRLFSQPAQAGLVYHEIDFPAVASKKLQLVKDVPLLRKIMPDLVSEGETWKQQLQNRCRYYCHGLDLRDLIKPDSKPLDGLRTDIPTLLISECCLCYLETTQAKDVIKYFTDKIPTLSIILYEPIKPDDPFGRQMVSNLAGRHIRMPTLEDYKNSEQQHARLVEAGFEQVREMTVEEIWRTWIPEEEKERVDSLEGLDEVEEWNLIAGHYIVAWAWRGEGLEAWDGIVG